MPIFWREALDPSPIEGIPSKLDVTITGPEDWGGVSLITTNQLRDTLEKIYRADENIGYLQDDNPLAEIYAPEYISFIQRHAKIGMHVSEIGAGGCYSLRRLKELGYRVSAIDPSPITMKSGLEYCIDVVPDFFPLSDKHNLDGVDIFTHYDVLEHVEDPETFLKSIYTLLSNGGKTLFVVPDSTQHLKTADLSMFIHQHLNYFSETSLRYLVMKSGFEIEELYCSKNTGTIYCSAIRNDHKVAATEQLSDLLRLCINEANYFFENAKLRYDATVGSLVDIFNRDKSQKIAFYPPLRAVPYIASLLHEYGTNIVFVDDNQKVQSRYICDLTYPIQSRQSALEQGVTQFVICSKPFREQMQRNLLNEDTNGELDIYFLDSLFEMEEANATTV